MRRFLLFVGLASAAVVGIAPSVNAHVQEPAGDLTISVGWRDEPTYAGLPNAVVVTAVDGRGAPVVDPGASLSTTLSFGDATVVLPLRPMGEPGAYGAAVVPTQPGTYAVDIVGTLRGEQIDITSTCSDATFHCVASASEVEFPPRPAIGVETTGGAGAVAMEEDESSAAMVLAIAALALSAVAVAATVTMGIRSRRTGRSA